WSGSTLTISTGAKGLHRLDAMVAVAEKYGVKLVLLSVNNWADYGGMDIYTSS
ncbi:hypothetical protein BDZ91DRAFT_658403, partial [Kalaharituber pfeilii]